MTKNGFPNFLRNPLFHGKRILKNRSIFFLQLQSDPRDSFAQIVTSSFPQLKEQEALINELRTSSNYFDSFEFKKDFWGCWSCNHPEKIADIIKEDGQPAMEGQLKEKKSKYGAEKERERERVRERERERES